jgi:hypothetical protein
MAYRVSKRIKQLRMGIKVEKEHKDTAKFIEKFAKKKIFPSRDLIYSKIAQDHLKEDPEYYTKLKKAGL